MGISWLMLYLFSCSATLAVFFHRKIEECFAVTIFLTISIVYFVGLFFTNLSIGVYICWGIGVFCCAYCFYSLRKYKLEVWKLWFTPGCVLYSILTIFLWSINRYRYYVENDEFSHWGIVIKNMFFFNRFGNYSLSTDLFKGYPPGTALWEYFVTKIYGFFSEPATYIAMGLALIAFVIPVMALFEWKKAVMGAILTIVLLMTPAGFFPQYLVNLCVDDFLGILMFYILFANYRGRETLYDKIKIALALFVLTLTKASGITLALISLLTIMIADISIKKGSLKWKEYISYVTAILLGKYSWTIYLKVCGTSGAWNTSAITVSNLISFFKGEGKEYQYQVVHNFIEVLWSRSFSDIHSHINTIVLIIMLCIFYGALLFYRKRINHKKDRKIEIYVITLFTGLLLYMLGLLILYIFTYTEYEAVRLASFTRYMRTYYIAMILWGMGVLIAEVTCSSHKWMLYLLTGLYLFCGMILTPVYTIRNGLDYSFAYMQRQDLGRFSQYYHYLQQENAKVNVICQHTAVYEMLYLKYLVAPDVYVREDYYSIGTPSSEGDVWTQNVTLDEWLNIFTSGETTHVYLYKINDEFENVYGKAFADPVQEGHLYKFNRDSQMFEDVLSEHE